MPYQKKALKGRNFFQRLLGLHPRENLGRALGNLLAEKELKHIRREEVEQILAEQGGKDWREEELLELLRPLLSHYLVDRCLDLGERENLDRFRGIFALSGEGFAALQNQIAAALYREALEDALADGELSPAEEAQLQALAEALEVSPELKKSWDRDIRGAWLEDRLLDMVNDQLYSPEEEETLKRYAQQVGGELHFSTAVQEKLQRYRRWWQLQCGPLPALAVPYQLYREEQCHAHYPARWLEWKTETRRYHYGGPALRIRLAKGLYWRTGSLGVKRIKEDVLRPIDTGELLITNKRLLFVGERRTRMIRLKRILDFEVYADGLQIKKDAGSHPLLKIDDTAQEAPLMLDRLLREQ